MKESFTNRTSPGQPVTAAQSWRKTLWIVFAAQLCTSMGFSTIFPFLPLYLGHLSTTSHLSTATLSGLVYSSQAVTMMIASPIWGALADRYGRKPMVVRAMAGGGLTIALMGFVHTAEQLIVLRAVQGLLSGVISATSALIVSKVPRDKVGYSMGILQLGLWSGVSVGPLAGGVLSDLFGFRVTFVVTAVMLCGAGIAVWRGVDESHTPPAAPSRGIGSLARNWRRILAYPGLITTLILRFMVGAGRTAYSPILPLFVQSLMPGTMRIAGYTGLIVGLSSAASTAGAVWLGRLGDRVGHQRVALVSALATGAFFLPQSFVTAPWQLMVLFTLSGAGIGGLTPSLSALLARFSKPADAGSVYGIDNSINAAARSVSPMVAAAVSAGLGLGAVFSVTGVMFLAAAVIMAAALPKKDGPLARPEAPRAVGTGLAEAADA